MKINYDETFESPDGTIYAYQRAKVGKDKLPMRSPDGSRYIVEDVPVTMKDVLVGASNVPAGPDMTPLDIALVGGAGIAASRKMDLQEDQLRALLGRVPLSIRVPFFCTVVCNRINEIISENGTEKPNRVVKSKKR